MCLAELTVQGRTRVQSLNVSNVLAEVVTGWDIAALGVEDARRAFETGYLPKLRPEQHEQARTMFREMEKRITSKLPAPVADDQPWAAWSAA
jgi:hypothetical protein